MGNPLETSNKEVISWAVVEAAAEAAYEAVRPRMGFPTCWSEAPEPLRGTYRGMSLAALEAGLALLRTDDAIREARATELESLADYIRGASIQPLHDRYTLRKISVEANQRAIAIRSGE